MQFTTNSLIQNKDVINTMENILDNQFNLVYLDLPWFTGRNGYFIPIEGERNSELKAYLAKQSKCDIRIISITDIKEERLKRRAVEEKSQLDEYSSYITKILENSRRILTKNGILCFRSPADTCVDYKIMLDQIFSTTYIMQVTLEKRTSNIKTELLHMNHEILYLYSKSKEYSINKIYEDFTSYEDEFKLIDERGRYKLSSLLQRQGGFSFSWKGTIPSNNLKWRYSKEKLEEFYKEKRIVIKETGKVFLKYYQKEHPREKSTVWKVSNDTTVGFVERQTSSILASHFKNIINLATNDGGWIFSPYSTDCKLPVIAQNMNRNWVVINPTLSESYNYVELLGENTYVILNKIDGTTANVVYKKLIKNVEDINELKSKLFFLENSITDIKNQIGVDGQTVEVVLGKIYNKINELIAETDIENYIPYVKDWVNPYWDKLEEESQFFLPTAELLFKEYKELNKFDLSSAMVEYCKALEKEIYNKIFKGYIRSLVSSKIDVKIIFSMDFQENETKKFADAVKQFTTRYKIREDKWHFELGTMVYILNIVLGEESKFLKGGRIYKDFKDYLEKHFEMGFFDIKFNIDLDTVAKLRNDSAHPQIVTLERINGGKELIKQKIRDLLHHYSNHG